eukprot:4038138-Amphidinium_carterae.1
MRYLHVQQLQSDGELKIHKVSTENNPSNLMTKYLEAAKIKKHGETIELHPYIGNKSSINMISHRPLRQRGSYTTRPRATTPQPRQRTQCTPCLTVEEDYIIKADDDDDATEMVRLQYSAEEAARDDVNNEKNNKNDQDGLHLTNAILQTISTTSTISGKTM